MNCKVKNKFLIISIILITTIAISLGYYLYLKNEKYKLLQTNNYNESFGNLVDYVNSVESLLAKSIISKNSEYSAEALTEVWRDSNLASVYLSALPMHSQELSQTSKFLNQVSDYSFSLSRKNIRNENLTEEELKNLKELHQYSVQLEKTLNQLSEELYAGTIHWDELTQKMSLDYTQAVDNVSVFSNIDSNLNKYEGLIYDGAYSDHINKANKVGLVGDDITQDEAYEKVKDFFEENTIKEIRFNNLMENADIECYDFSVDLNENENANIEISKKGGWIVEMQANRDVDIEKITQEEANQIGKKFLSEKGFDGMEATYFTKLYNIVTINYAYKNNNIIAYPDLIKVKVALDNGEILGIETKGYLNSHTSRKFSNVKISIDEAREKLNTDLEILSEEMAIIPTEWKTELLCYEFKGKADGREFLVYVNCETGKEEQILVILDTPGGTLTV